MLTSVQRVRDICKQKGIPISKLEQICGFGNGYLNPKKQTKLPYDRALLIADYLGVSPEYILIGEEERTPTEDGKGAIGDDIKLMSKELDMLRKFRCLDDRGKSAVLNLLEHEYAALPQAVRAEEPAPAAPDRSILRVAARDGTFTEYILTDAQVAKLAAYLDSLPDVPEDL